MAKSKKLLLISIILLLAIIAGVLVGNIIKQKEPDATNLDIVEFNTNLKPQIKNTVFTNATEALNKPSPEVVPGEIIIKFHPGKIAQFKPTDFGLKDAKQIITDVYVYRFDADTDMLQLMEKLYQDNSIKYAEPNYLAKLASGNLKQFTNAEYQFSFSYPSNYKSCCSLSGPTVASKPMIVLADVNLEQRGTDKPFNGLGIYVIENVSDFNALIDNEKQGLQARAEAMGQTPDGAATRQTTVGSLTATELVLSSWDKLNRIYLMLPDSNEVLVISYHFEFSGIRAILDSFSFEVEPQSVISNDPLVNKQWSLSQQNNIDINIEPAWQMEGEFEPVIAVVDSGIMLDHEDLAGQIWINTDEIAGNSIDDDINGYIDDVNGYNFSNTNTVINGANPHGTWTSGVIGAKRDNQKGIAGICGKCKIMPLVFYIEMAETEEQAQSNVVIAMQAFAYAHANGARIISNSWTMNYFSNAMQDQINDLYNQEILVIAAAGNSNSDSATGWYPAQMQNVIAVGAIDSSGNKSLVSNFGSWIDIAAPATALPMINPYTGSPVTSEPLEGLYSTDAYIQEGISGGTSIATPHIAGVAGLLLTRNIDLRAEQLEELLLNNITPHTQTQFQLGSGIINAGKAMQASLQL